MIRDRHSRTERRLAFRRRVKRYALPLAGFLALAAIGEIAALDLTAVAAGIWGGMAAFLDQIGIDLGTYSASRPIVNGLVGAVLGSLATGLLGRLGVFDRLFPDPPGFVFCDLEVERSRSLLEVELGAPTSFVGRGEELEALEALLENPSPQRFRWQTVTAPSGVGKTRLAIEWLERAEKAEWDIGVIDPDQLGKVKAWKARRPTALVLDEADSGFYLQSIGTTTRLAALLGDLLRASSKQAPVRLLLLGQSTVWAAGQAPDAIRPYAVKDPLVLTPLDDEAMGVLAAELARHSGGDAELIVGESAGRPRHALVLARARPGTASYRDALNQWTNATFPALANEQEEVDQALATGLIAAALIGSVPTSALAARIPGFAVGPLLRFFPGLSRRQLENSLPRLEPEDWAQLLALRLIDRMPPLVRDEVITPLLTEYPDQLERSLAAIWRDCPHWVEGHRDHPAPSDWQATAATTLRALQAAYDARWPDRVAAMHDKLMQASKVFLNDASLADVHLAAIRVASMSDARPFDLAIRIEEAKAGVSAINCYGEAGTARQEAAFAAIERWNMRFDSLLAIPTLAANVDVRLNEAKASVNAIKYYGEVGAAGVEGAFAALESWAGRIDRLISVPELGANPKLRLFEAEAAVNAIGTYGRVAAREWVKAYTALERWGERLAALVAVPLFADDLDIRLREAMAVMNAVTSYGKFASGGQSDAFLALERWGTRLDAALAVPVLAADQAIRSVEAQTVVNAVMAYGEVGASGRPEAFAALERWAERLDAISAIPSLANDPSIRLAEAKAVTNAINSYGEAAAAGQEGAFSALERWERRLDVLLSEPSLSADPSLRLQEAKAAVNAINFYGVAGAAGQAGAFAALERWGKRFDVLVTVPSFANHPSIRLEEAMAVTNAIASYGDAGAAGQAGAFDDLERWGKRLDALINIQPFADDPAIRLYEVKATVNAIKSYGEAGAAGSDRAFASLERWGERLNALLAVPSLASDPAIRLGEASAAANAIVFYRKAGLEDGRRRWRGRLARIAQRFPHHLEIAYRATEQNLTLQDQQARGWPYGRYSWTPDGQQQTLQEPKPGYE